MNTNKQKLLEQLVSNMERFRRVMQHLSSISFEERLATMLQIQALTVIKDHPHCTTGELGQALQMSSSSTTQFVERLYKDKHITRIHDEHDRRVVRLLLTTSGEQQMETHKKHMFKEISKLFELVPEKDIIEFIRIHQELIDKVERKYA